MAQLFKNQNKKVWISDESGFLVSDIQMVTVLLLPWQFHHGKLRRRRRHSLDWTWPETKKLDFGFLYLAWNNKKLPEVDWTLDLGFWWFAWNNKKLSEVDSTLDLGFYAKIIHMDCS